MTSNSQPFRLCGRVRAFVHISGELFVENLIMPKTTLPPLWVGGSFFFSLLFSPPPRSIKANGYKPLSFPLSQGVRLATTLVLELPV